ncbi:aspartate carbamoyltransferase catalytic subunit [Streptococcus ratti]|uniref:Aspartate carbamoyltransferase n=1 Tax=Streptococcus ratti FA-1 = DSM 20564 TaxID=699248 RepID=A0ABP2QXF3_STRRT|nr:aspartate carbamoyltransferase catalytic subunit [Streptococcus ratti]EJN93739.1 aspartate carbamoyltransferase catalytic subunit [Streptococcus ratti FA-1 = DSM 20564]EMP70648.1 aspartate carbamoyltransferase catalytic subunit [Streptococcus ratti FA-1 = DSM 20564]QEY07594.1 aspartate carbamoyltransferase catalytic subunit [Streptococcus ratti]VEI60053.1 aspartate carbamoyltransferase catalytic subunit [Streptococcus mutans]
MIFTDGVVSLKHLVSMEILSNEEVLGLIKRGLAFKEKKVQFSLDRQYFAANLFFESSTRTHKSFEVAEKKLGLDVIEFDAKTSSVNKGETLYDTILTMSALGVDICVVRHSQDDYYKELIDSRTIQTSIVNGGDGSGQHPSQCLLDLMTIYDEFGSFENLKIAIVGDITHSRVAKSNMQILKRLGAQIYFAGPEEWYSSEFDVYGKHVAIDEIIDEVDVLMLLRVQHERHDGKESFSKETYHQHYGLTKERYGRLKDSAIIMHPAPVNRDVEIADSLVEAPKSRIVAQMKNGVFVRMAILEAILKGKS